MLVQEYARPQFGDYDLPKDFVTHCKDNTVPIAVIGNGGSLSKLTKQQIETLNKCRLFRCNWAFNDPLPIKKQYAMYFSQAYGLEENLRNRVDDAVDSGQMMIYRAVTDVLYNKHPLASFLNKLQLPVWPTTGIQMLLQAAHYQPPKVYIAGVDMYTFKRPKGRLTRQQGLKWLKEHGKTFSESTTNSIGTSFYKCSESNLTLVSTEQFIKQMHTLKRTAHYLEVDVLLLMHALAQFKITGVEIEIMHNPVIEYVNTVIDQNFEHIKKYFSYKTNLDSRSQQSSYVMWRLINKIMDWVMDD